MQVQKQKQFVEGGQLDTSRGGHHGLGRVGPAGGGEVPPRHPAASGAAGASTGPAAHATPLLGSALALPAEAALTIPRLLLDVVAERRGRVALRMKKLGIYRNVSWIDLLEEVSRIGLGLHALGVRRGDRVAIIGDPLPEWLLSDLAAQCLGAISYGLYPTSSRDEVEFLLRHGGASVLVAEDQEHVDKVLPLLGRLPDLRKVVVIDDSNMFDYDHPALMSLQELGRLGASIEDGEDRYLRLCRDVHPDDAATIVYTSGTSANPKGAVYTHRALVTQGHQFFAFPELARREVFRSVVHLPLNHLYERMNTPLGMLVKGIVPHFGDDAQRFLETLSEVAPQHHASVPRYWSKLASRVIVGIENSSAAKRLSYKAAMRIGQACRRRRWSGERARLLGALYWLARVGVFNRMLKKIGLHRVRIALSAGAPLPSEVQALWQVWGVNLKNLFGQTEGGVLAAQFDSFPRPGSVGAPYPGVEIRLGADEEIIGKSPGSFVGYWSDPAASAEVLQPDGIHTGDIGMLDGDGQLWIVDRKKDIVITAGGKNVSPSRIETALKSSPYISEASVIGEGRKYLTALIELDVGTATEWARANNVLYTSYRSLASNGAICALIEQEVKRANERLGRVEQVKAFRILDRELDPELEGEAVTPTRKIKRTLLQRHFGHLIDQMYSDDEQQRIGRQLVG
jgi:long-chain acyl-CoA synthetase